MAAASGVRGAVYRDRLRNDVTTFKPNSRKLKCCAICILDSCCVMYKRDQKIHEI